MREGCRVLIVEDDDDVQRLLQTLVRHRCATIDVAADGERAIELLRANAYDIVVLDIMLPKKNGFEVAEFIKTMPSRPGVVVLSAIARYFRDRFPADAVVLQKPFDIKQFDDALEQVLPLTPQ